MIGEVGIRLFYHIFFLFISVIFSRDIVIVESSLHYPVHLPRSNQLSDVLLYNENFGLFVLRVVVQVFWRIICWLHNNSHDVKSFYITLRILNDSRFGKEVFGNRYKVNENMFV